MFHSFTEVVGGQMRVWGQSSNCRLQGLMDKIGILEQSTCRKLACWLDREAVASGKGSLGFVTGWKD